MKEDKKRIMILGGAFTQIPAIEYAKSAGYHVITCDYLPDNPGHKVSDEYYNISTTDMEAVLEKARELEVDGILGFASGHATVTAAYVCERLNLPGPSSESVNKLKRKDVFRQLQVDNGLNSIGFYTLDTNDGNGLRNGLDFPVVVKPVDSTGSKGVEIVHDEAGLCEAIENALPFSMSGKCIVEEYIKTSHRQLHGDGFVYEGKLVFLGLCDQYHNHMAPLASVYPPQASAETLEKARLEIERTLEVAGYELGGINVEVRLGLDDKIYVVEINPRSGSNFVTQLMKSGPGFDEVRAAVETAMGRELDTGDDAEKKNCLLYFLTAQEDGILDRIDIKGEVSGHVKHLYARKEAGDEVHKHRSGADIVAFLIAGYDDRESLERIMEDLDEGVVLRDETEGRKDK